MQVALRINGGCLLAALLFWSPPALAADPVDRIGAMRVAQASPAAMAEYRRLLAQYLAARQQYEAVAESYWNAVAEKRRLRMAKRRNGQDILLQDYVLTQPPVYSGPPRPAGLPAPRREPRDVRLPPIPRLAEFIRAAAEHYKFVPQRPDSDLEFKRAYARVALAAGLTEEQAVRIYAFETGFAGTPRAIG